jgi:hypothetical protein
MGFDEIAKRERKKTELNNLKDQIIDLYEKYQEAYSKYESSAIYVTNRENAVNRAIVSFVNYFTAKRLSITEDKINNNRLIYATVGEFTVLLEVRLKGYMDLVIKDIENDTIVVTQSNPYIPKFQGRVSGGSLHIIGDLGTKEFYLVQIENLKQDINNINKRASMTSSVSPEFIYELYSRGIQVNDIVEYLDILDEEINRK